MERARATEMVKRGLTLSVTRPVTERRHCTRRADQAKSTAARAPRLYAGDFKKKESVVQKALKEPKLIAFKRLSAIRVESEKTGQETPCMRRSQCGSQGAAAAKRTRTTPRGTRSSTRRACRRPATPGGPSSSARSRFAKEYADQQTAHDVPDGFSFFGESEVGGKGDEELGHDGRKPQEQRSNEEQVNSGRNRNQKKRCDGAEKHGHDQSAPFLYVSQREPKKAGRAHTLSV